MTISNYFRFGGFVQFNITATNQNISGEYLLAKAIQLTGSLSGSATVYVPHSAGADYLINNATGQTITIKGSPGETGISIVNGADAYIYSTGTAWRANTGGVAAALDIHGLTQKSSLAPADEFAIYDSVAATNKRATLANVESSLVDPVIDTLAQRIGVGHRSALQSAPTRVFAGIGDGTSFPTDVKFEASPTGVRWSVSKRELLVANGASIYLTLGYVYVDADHTKCTRVGGILTVESSARDTSMSVKVAVFQLSAGYVYDGAAYEEDTLATDLGTAAGVSVSAVHVNGGVAPTAGAWYAVTAQLVNSAGQTTDIKLNWEGSSCW